MWLPLVSFAIAAAATPVLTKFIRDRGLVGRDMHKMGLPSVPSAGGIAIFIIMALFLIYLDLALLAGVVLLTGAFSLLDDIYQYGTVYKILFPLIISLLFYFEVGQYGLLLAVPYFILVTNLPNTLAGFNGLEAGLGGLIALAFGGFLFFLAEPLAQVPLILTGACFGFLLYNWYPAKVFPGNVGTYTIGAVLAGVGLLSGYWYVLLFLFIPHLADIGLKFRSAGIVTKIVSRSKKNTLSEFKPLIYRNGKLYLPKKSYLSLVRLMLRKPRSEQEIVTILLAAEAILGIILVLAV